MDGDFAEVLELLLENDIKFIVVGGVACALNGYIRATDDVDIIIETSEGNIRNLLETLVSWGDGYAKELDVSDFELEPGAVRIIEDFPLDIFTIMSEMKYQDFIVNAGRSQDGIRYLSPPDLILTKQSSHREKDKLDIITLKRIID